MFHLKEGFSIRKGLLYGLIFATAAALIWVVLRLLGVSLGGFWWMFLLLGAVLFVQSAALLAGPLSRLE